MEGIGTNGVLYRLEECWAAIEAQRREIAERDAEIIRSHQLSMSF